jgi:hypothetical protein
MMERKKIFVEPIPPVEENTTWFGAGALTFGVEYRLFNEQVLRDTYQGQISSDRIEDDAGVSLHVIGTDDRKERLRFDCFVRDPHYHYILPAESCQLRIPFDESANGPMLDWALGRLRTRMSQMLRETGADELAEKCDPIATRSALDQVEELARRADIPASTP